jgi:hypothetical protein
MTTSAYNLGNAGLASKILRIKDLTSLAAVEGFSVLGIETVCFWLTAFVRAAGLAGRLRICQCGSFEILSKGCSSQGWGFLLWRVVEKKLVGENSQSPP